MEIGMILVAFDGSEESTKALDMGIDMASKYGAGLQVVSVVRPPEPPIAVEMEAVVETALEYYRKLFEQMGYKFKRAGIGPKFEVRVGHPAEQIVMFANEMKADVIVTGHRSGRSFFKQWCPGSIALRVMNYAQCTVVVVR